MTLLNRRVIVILEGDFVKFEMDKVPAHVAIIMDGNGRWAKKRFLPRIAGHKKGSENLRAILNAAGDFGIKCLTVYAFSTENWGRPEDEVNGLMNLLRFYIETELEELNKKDVRITMIGELSNVAEDLRKSIINAIEYTKNNKGLRFNIAFNYGSRSEMVRAIKLISTEVANNNLRIDDINDKIVSEYLYTNDMEDPDLLIRTSGELRISNFLLWQLAYTELYFTDKLWPDFGKKDLEEAIVDFQNRKRRFGKL